MLLVAFSHATVDSVILARSDVYSVQVQEVLCIEDMEYDTIVNIPLYYVIVYI